MSVTLVMMTMMMMESDGFNDVIITCMCILRIVNDCGFLGAKLRLFGSSCNGFGFQYSDLDISLTFADHETAEVISSAFCTRSSDQETSLTLN